MLFPQPGMSFSLIPSHTLFSLFSDFRSSHSLSKAFFESSTEDIILVNSFTPLVIPSKHNHQTLSPPLDHKPYEDRDLACFLNLNITTAPGI
jgi:hypothetical protein